MGKISTAIGAIVSRQNVEQAILSTLRTWLPIYLTEIEQQNDLDPMPRPPAADSFYGGVDNTAWMEANLPAIIVTAEPVEDAELFGTGDYGQQFEVQVTAVVVGTAAASVTDSLEDSGRALADWYGAAVMAALLQKGDLGGVSSRTRMIEFPKTEIAQTDDRVFAQTVQMMHVYVESVVNEDLSALSPTVGGQSYEVLDTNFSLEVVPDANQVDEST